MNPWLTPRLAEILLVEDNADNAHLTGEAFDAASLLVNRHYVSDGEKSLQFLRKQGPYTDVPTPDLIFLDTHMPVMEGQEVPTAIVADDRL